MGGFKFKKTIYAFVAGFLLSGSLSTAKTFYQINSESLNNPRIDVTQADLKLLLGLQSDSGFIFDIFKENRLSVGSYTLYQSAKDPSYFVRTGAVVQARSRLTKHLYLQYEHHEYKYRTSYSEVTGTTPANWFSENRYGVFYTRWDQFGEHFTLDTYAETFYIPEISTSNWLSVVRFTAGYRFAGSPNLFPIAEAYLKEAPNNYGGTMRDLRLGVQYRPADWVSLKLMGNVAPQSEQTTSGLLFQLNIFKEGEL